MKSNCSCSRVICADTKYIPSVVDEVIGFLQSKIGLSDEAIFEIKVILNELLVNAVVHGNKEDIEKKVYVKAGVSKDSKIYVIVEDEGEGLTTEVNACCKELLGCDEVEVFCLNENGRGLIITSSLCDCLKRNKKGNKVVILKKIDPCHIQE